MAQIKPFTVSNELLDQPEKLREQAQQDGYLFFRGLIDTDSIYSLRQDFLEICHRHGWAQGGEALMDGIRTGGPFMEGDDGYVPVLDEFQSMESFHAFAHHPAILDMCDKLFGEKTLVHPRNIGRIMFPENTKYTTPAHQDYIHIRGTEETYTAWIPLGPCLTELGGLSILSGSHRSGIYPVKPAFGAGGLGIDTEPLEADGLYWVAGDYKIGDGSVLSQSRRSQGTAQSESRSNSTLSRLSLSRIIATRYRRVATAAFQPNGMGRNLYRLEINAVPVLLERL